jgi:hypothetical protein
VQNLKDVSFSFIFLTEIFIKNYLILENMKELTLEDFFPGKVEAFDCVEISGDYDLTRERLGTGRIEGVGAYTFTDDSYSGGSIIDTLFVVARDPETAGKVYLINRGITDENLGRKAERGLINLARIQYLSELKDGSSMQVIVRE